MENIYPDISEINMNANVMLNKLECKHMLEQINNMKDKLKHYKKLRKRWKKIKNATRITCHTTGVILEVGGIALTFYSGVTIPLIIAGVGILDNLSTEIFAKLLQIKVKKYEDKSKIIQKYIHELFLFIKNATSDNVISPEEIIEYQNILKAYDREINTIKEVHDTEVNQIIPDKEKLDQIFLLLNQIKGIGT